MVRVIRGGLWALCALSFGTGLAWGRDRPLQRAEYELEDGGRMRTFAVATDEVVERDFQGRWSSRLTSPRGNAEGLRQWAKARPKSIEPDTELVLYPLGAPRTEKSRRMLRRTLVYRVHAGVDPAAVALAHDLLPRGEHGGARGYYVAEVTEVGGALEAAEELRSDPTVLWVQPQIARAMKPRFTPNDTYFSQQWHLLNTGQGGGLAGTDGNLTDIWDAYRGSGVRIGIVDDGLPTAHPDLSPSADTANDHDWNDDTPNDPSPSVANGDFHGTAVAGIAGASGNNGIGVAGVAPEATLVGLRLISGSFTDSDEAEAMGWKKGLIEIKNNSWGPDDLANTLVGPGTLMAAAMEDAVATGRGGKGTVITWAGGNGGEIDDNSNYDGYANSIYVIGVGAVGNNGTRAVFSELGANLAVVAPSAGGTLKMVTTDLQGTDGYNTSTSVSDLAQRAYTNNFGGTSAATPVVSGICALMLQANPNLGWRDVKEILIRTARNCDPSDADWVVNGGGIHFNHKYGAGLVDAEAAVNMAIGWANLPAMQEKKYAQTGLNVSIPNNNATGITRSFSVSEPGFRAEQVTVRVNLTHPGRGDLEIVLTSPSGTQSRLAEPHNDTNDDIAPWTFSSMRHWGEAATGTWTLRIADRKTGNGGGSLKAATLSIFGAPGNQRPQVNSAALSAAPSLIVGESVNVTGVIGSDPENDPVTFRYQWQMSDDGTAYTDIAGAVSATLSVTPTQAGRAVRCQVFARDAGGDGPSFATAIVDVQQVPTSSVASGQMYSFDCDLYIPGGVGNYRLATISDNVPGLSINPQTGLYSGMVNQNQGGFYSIVIERHQGNSVGATQSYTLLVIDMFGRGVVPAGKTHTLRGNGMVDGDVVVEGTLDTSGHALVVNGVFKVTGTVNNASGSISYLGRDGSLPPGTISLIPNPANDLADSDADGLPNLMEFLLGSNPSAFSTKPPVARVNSRNTLTFTTPLGAVGAAGTVEVSGDLVTWSSGPGATETIANTTSGLLRTITVRDVIDGPVRYIRLKSSR